MQIDQPKSWTYFDGASQGESPVGGVGGILNTYELHIINFKVGIGQGSNKKVELMAPELILTLTPEFGVISLQAFGDSLLLIE